MVILEAVFFFIYLLIQFIFVKYQPLQVGIILCFNLVPVAVSATRLVESGTIALQQGRLEQAIHYWQHALEKDNLNLTQRLDILIQIGNTYQALGFSQQALEVLLPAESLLQSSKNHTLSEEITHAMAWNGVKLFASLSDTFLAQRQDQQAREYINKSKAILPANAPTLIQALLFNQEGNVLAAEAYYVQAITVYARSIHLAQQAGDRILVARALINKAYTHLKIAQWNHAVTSLKLAKQQLQSTPDNYAKIFSLISIGAWAQHHHHQLGTYFQEALSKSAIQNQAELQVLAYHTLTSALRLAKQLDNTRLISYAYGYLGHLYETKQQYTEALRLTRQAIFYAKQEQASFFSQQEQGSEMLYRWQWQLGRLFKTQQQIDNAIKAYQDAVKSLQPIRQELALGYRKTVQSFRERVGPIYFGLADLLLQRATHAHDPNVWLKQALRTIELMKTFELQDYFQDECVTEFNHQQFLLEHQQPHTAVLYPILLTDRAELLLSLGDNSIERFSVSIPATILKDEVNEFRFELETRGTMAFLPYAQRLYRWFIAPLEATLITHQITTLIIVPDSILRTIPFAALHDGKQFLIANYAIATIPSLTLTTFQPYFQEEITILINSLSQSVQGYPALSSVVKETYDIQRLYKKNASILLDQNFTVANLADALKNTSYSIIHIASHGQFDSDPSKTFLLTYDGKLTMNQLEQLIQLRKRRNEPVELLTLSACQTAVGDEQAALGLAGIAFKAGAQSALATLWFIDDKATASLIREFYRQLHQQKQSKAKSLQMAQLYLLKDTRYQHPAWWAPFLLIGNWQ